MSIWKHSKYLIPEVTKEFRLTLNEGQTALMKCKKLAKFLKLQQVYIKREDQNPSGSFKDRSLAYQLSNHYQSGANKFVICSSGNAAISAISYCKLFDCFLSVFVSKNIPADKLMRLLDQCEIKDFDHIILKKEGQQVVQKDKLEIFFSKKPKSNSIKYANENETIHLRGSNDNLAPIGFKTITYEMLEEKEKIDSIFIPCSSGTSTVGIYQGFLDLKKKIPQIHIVQTTKIHPMASVFDKIFLKTETSLASAISDRVAFRKDQVTQIVSRSGGSGWVINDDESMTAQNLLKQHCDIDASFDSSLSLAGLIKTLSNRYLVKRPVLILSGG